MRKLTELPNIGNVLAEKLIPVGIETPDDLKKCFRTIDKIFLVAYLNFDLLPQP